MHQTAFFNLTWGNYVMVGVACFFLFLAIKKDYEPLLLVPIAFGMLLVNIYPDIMLHADESANGVGGLLYYFYVLDEWRLGTVGERPFAQMAQSEAARRFVEASRHIPEECRVCPVYPVCRNGCRRDRLVTTEGIIGGNYYCKSYKRFFTERKEELREAIGLVLELRRRAANGS